MMYTCRMKSHGICPVTEREYPVEEGQDGHIIPEKLGGTTTIRTWEKIDQTVGTRYDAELIAYVSHCRSGRLRGHVTMPAIIDGKLKIEISPDGQFQAKVRTNLKERITARPAPTSEAPILGTMTVYLPNPQKIVLSMVHSAILFGALKSPEKQGNLSLFRRLLNKALTDAPISADEWDSLSSRFLIICPERDRKTLTLMGSAEVYDHDAVAFNYDDTCYGICKLDGTWSDHPDGKIRVFILPK
jgi:hypothetical protein